MELESAESSIILGSCAEQRARVRDPRSRLPASVDLGSQLAVVELAHAG